LHACITERLALTLDRSLDVPPMPERMEVTYVREMELRPPTPAAVAPPPPAAPAPPPTAPATRVPLPAAAAASAPDEVTAAATQSENDLSLGVQEEAPSMEDIGEFPLSDGPDMVAGEADADASADALPEFDWPESTRLSYVLTGNYRGEVHGNAQVEWIRSGNRYQVHLDVTVGPGFAPLFYRRMSSEGILTMNGLAPQRYDEESKALFRSARRRMMRFEPNSVILANGEAGGWIPGVQDTASQFVQLTYLFSTRPDLLEPGQTIQMPLALPRHVSLWHYDVHEPETLSTRFGDISGILLKPRREARKADDLTFDVWVSPELAYLPVRIRITQDDETHIDLLISKRPDIALPALP
jgi:hypothetical protein